MSPSSSAIVLDLYRSVSGMIRWDESLGALARHCGFQASAVYAYDLAADAIVGRHWTELDPALMADYERDYQHIDPRRRLAFAESPPPIRYDYLHTSETQMRRDPFYQWIERSHGWRYYLGAQSRNPEGLQLTATLHRGPKGGHATADEIQRFQGLFAHLTNAIALHRTSFLLPRLRWIEQFEVASAGVIALDQQRRVVYANPAAETIFRMSDGLVMTGRQVRATSSAEDSLLQKTISGCLDGRLADCGVPIALTRPHAAGRYELRLLPMGADGHDLLPEIAPRLVIQVSDPVARLVRQVRQAGRLYGLTPSESRVMQTLLEGSNTRETARRLNLQYATVRTYLTVIYRKTGCSGLSQLLRRVQALSPPPMLAG